MARHDVTFDKRKERLQIRLEGLSHKLLVSGIFLISHGFHHFVKIFNDSSVVTGIRIARDADFATIKELSPEPLQPLLSKQAQF